MNKPLTHLRDERGAVELLVAAGMVFFLVLAALVIDIGNADQTNRGLQNAADSGALAATQQLNSPINVVYGADYALDTLNQPHVGATPGCGGAPAGEVPAAASNCYAFSSSGAINGWVYVTTPWGPDTPFGGCSGSCPTANQEVNVKVCQTVNTSFARVVNVSSERLCKAATGVLGTTTQPLALFASGNGCSGNGLTFNSSNSNVSGVVWSNSLFTMTGTNNTLGPTFYVCPNPHGGYPGGGNTYNGQSVPLQAAARPDPCASSPYPSQCDPTAIVCDITLPGTSPADFTPVSGKVYCLDTNNNVNIILSDASYTDTFIVNRTNPGGSKLNFKCSGNCTVSGVPGTGGGFVVWNNAQPSSCSSELITNNGSGTLDLDGTIYAPGGKINLNLGTNGTNNAFLNGCTLAVNGTVNGTGPGVPVSNTQSNLIR